jgi:Peptidase C13 family
MRSRMFVWLIVAVLPLVAAPAFAQDAPVPQTPTTEVSGLTWKAALMAGDNQLDVFDNATKTLKSMFLRMGVQSGNIRELSASQAEIRRGALPANAENLEGSLRDLAVGKGDACLVHLTSHGTRQGFFLRNAPGITPARLNSILERSCGDQPTVVLISACYSGVFLDRVMLKPNRIILTAAAEDRTSFGCSSENQYTYWDGCLIDSFSQSDNWALLYGAIKKCVETKEAQNRFMPSLPRAFFGEAIASLRTPAAPAQTGGAIDAAASRCPITMDEGYGLSAGNPVKVGLDAASGPARELQYLNALRGPTGQPLRFRRVGTTLAGTGILDIYELNYEGLASPVRIYLDAYHFDEPIAPHGFVCPIAIGLQP